MAVPSICRGTSFAVYGFVALLFLPGLTAFVGCGGREGGQTNNASVVRTTVGEVPTLEQLEAFGVDFEKAVYSGNSVTIGRLFQGARTVDLALSGIELPAGDSGGFRTGMLEGLQAKGIQAQLGEVTRSGGDFRYMRVLDRTERPRVLFRILGVDGSLNYLEAVVELNPANQEVRAVDFYSYSTGELMTATLRRETMRYLAASESNTFLNRLTGTESDLVRELPNIMKMYEAIGEGNGERAMEIYANLPATLKKEKTILLARFNAANLMGAESGDFAEVEQAVHDLRETFPKDPCLDLLELDYYFVRNDMHGVMNSLDKLNEQVEGDPYLFNIKAGLLLDEGSGPGAIEVVREGLAQFPDDYDLLTQGLVVAAEQGERELFLKWYDAASAIEKPDPEFLGSLPNAATWLKDRK